MSKRELLFSITRKDLEITWYKSSGGGGQKKNKTANACRIRHPDSGVLVTASERRERPRNLRAAFERLVRHPKFKIWHTKRANEEIDKLEGRKTIEKLVEESMAPSQLRVEVKEDGKWVKQASQDGTTG